MKTGLTKRQKTTAIFFDEQGDMIEVRPITQISRTD